MVYLLESSTIRQVIGKVFGQLEVVCLADT